MAVMASVFNEVQRSTLEALCDTFVPAVESDTGDPVERAFLARAASDMQVAAQIEEMLAEALIPEEIAEVGGLLDALADEGLADADLEGRTQIVHGVRAASPEAKQGLTQLKGLTLLVFYGMPDDEGSNVNWEALGYPGPISAAPSAADAPKTISLAEVSGEQATLDVRRVRGGLGRRRQRDRRRGRRGGTVGAGARDGPVPERVRLQPARGAGLLGALLRRRARYVRGRLDRDPRRPDARRRHRRQLHELHPDAGADHATSGRRTGSWGSRTTPRTAASTSTW